MYTTLKILFKEHEGKEFRINDYNFKIEDGKLCLYSGVTNQYLPVCTSQLGQKYIDKIEEILSKK